MSGAISQISEALRAWAGPVRGTFGSGDIQRRSCWGLIFKAGSCHGDTVWCLVFVPLSSCRASDIAVKSRVIVEQQVYNPLYTRSAGTVMDVIWGVSVFSKGKPEHRRG